MNAQPNGILDYKVYPLKENLLSTCTGNNQKGLFVGCKGTPRPDTLELLGKMLQAAKFDLAEDALLCWLPDEQPFSISSLRNEASFSKALLFGIPPKQAGVIINAQAYQPVSIGGVSYLFSGSLDEIIANPALKRPLWEGMKGMFGV
ncbi:MAG: hypothetical protein IPN76_28565 [Saprospiraceae bacterium]|jgi:hypothetical protein|nr:hypothetical protein [Saprospiraceae bacterium]